MFSGGDSRCCVKALSTRGRQLGHEQKRQIVVDMVDIPKYFIRFELDLEDHEKPRKCCEMEVLGNIVFKMISKTPR